MDPELIMDLSHSVSQSVTMAVNLSLPRFGWLNYYQPVFCRKLLLHSALLYDEDVGELIEKFVVKLEKKFILFFSLSLNYIGQFLKKVSPRVAFVYFYVFHFVKLEKISRDKIYWTTGICLEFNISTKLQYSFPTFHRVTRYLISSPSWKISPLIKNSEFLPTIIVFNNPSTICSNSR